MNKIVFSFIFFLLVIQSTKAQVDTLSLSQAIELAQKNNRNIILAKIGNQRSTSRMNEVKATRYPSLFFRSHFLHAPYSPTGYEEAITNGGEYAMQFSAGIPLYDGGVRSAIIDQASNDIEKSTINFQKAKIEIAFTVRSVYYEILRAQEELRIRRETTQRLQEYVSFLKQLAHGGVATESDVLKAQVDLNNAMVAVDGAVQAVTKAKLQMNNILGGSLQRTIEVIPMNPNDSISLPEFSIQNNIDFQLMQRDSVSASFDVTIAQAERLPTLSIVGDAGVLGIQLDQFRNNIGYSVLLSLDLPLFTWGGIENRIQQKELAERQIETQLELQRRDIETQWRLTLSDLELAQKNLLSYSSNISEAENNYLTAKSRFAGGSGSNLEVLDAHRLLVDVKLNQNNSLFQLRISFANAMRLSGQ